MTETVLASLFTTTSTSLGAASPRAAASREVMIIPGLRRESGPGFQPGPLPERLDYSALLRVDHDAATAEAGCGGRPIHGTHLVVIDDGIAVVLVPDLDPELVGPAATTDLAVDRGDQEAIVAGAVDRSGALVLGPGSGDDEPLIDRAVEIQIAGLELELGITLGGGCPLLVLGDETEVRLSDRRAVLGAAGQFAGVGRRVEPAASGHEPGARIIHGVEEALGVPAIAVLVIAPDADDEHTGHVGKRNGARDVLVHLVEVAILGRHLVPWSGFIDLEFRRGDLRIPGRGVIDIRRHQTRLTDRDR